MVERAAMVSELPKARKSSVFSNRRTYHSRLKPRQTVVRFEALKLNTTSTTSGR